MGGRYRVQPSDGSGSVAVPGSLSCTITVPYNDPTNPFLHQYHPDHDNKDARFQDFALPGGVTPTTAKISDGVEAPAITRACTFSLSKGHNYRISLRKKST